MSSRNNSITNLTGDSKTLDLSSVGGEIFRLAESKRSLSANAWKTINPAINELLTVPSTVNYVIKAANLYKSGYELNGSSYVINKLLGTTWLWDRVRVPVELMVVFPTLTRTPGCSRIYRTEIQTY